MVLHHKPVEDVLNHFETDVTSGFNDGQVATKRFNNPHLASKTLEVGD